MEQNKYWKLVFYPQIKFTMDRYRTNILGSYEYHKINHVLSISELIDAHADKIN